MIMLKANELMAGDIICQEFSNLVLVVSSVIPPYVQCVGEEGQFHEKTIKPIPLTPEILEKNGFLSNKHVYPYPYYEYEVKEIKVKVGFAFPQGNRTSYKDPWVYIDSERVFVEHLPCVFVHQLQHAFRLAGIEEEIVI